MLNREPPRIPAGIFTNLLVPYELLVWHDVSRNQLLHWKAFVFSVWKQKDEGSDATAINATAK